MRRPFASGIILVALSGVASTAPQANAPPLTAAWSIPRQAGVDPALATGLASDSQGNVYVVEAGANRIQKFSPEGSLLDRWGAPPGEPGSFLRPFGIAVGPDDSVYVTELGPSRVRHLDGAGREQGRWGRPGSAPGEFYEPRGIAVNSVGEVLVVDGENRRIQCFDAHGSYLRSWQPRPGEPGALTAPVGIALGPAGDVFVTDVAQRCVHRFSAQGGFLESWRPPDGFTAATFRPQAVVADSRGIVICDPWTAQLVEFDFQGVFQGRWPPATPGNAAPRLEPLGGRGEGTPSLRATGPAAVIRELLHPVALAFDPEGRLLVLDRGLSQARSYRWRTSR